LQRPRALQRTTALLRTRTLLWARALLLLLSTRRTLCLILIGLGLLILPRLILRLSLIARGLRLRRRCPQQRCQRNTLRLECNFSHVTQPSRPGSPAAAVLN
jgi:hypothetical protein